MERLFVVVIQSSVWSSTVDMNVDVYIPWLVGIVMECIPSGYNHAVC